MCYRPFSSKEDKVIRKQFGKMRAQDIGAKLGRSRSAITFRAKLLGLSYQPSFIGKNGMLMKRWTDEDIEVLRHWYRRKSIAELCEMFDRSKGQIVQKASKLGLKRQTPDYEGRILLERKKDGSVKRVQIIKGGLKKSYARHVWERHNGPVPPGKKVVTKTGNPLDCRRIESLELISHRMMMYRNSGQLTEDEAIAYDIIGDINQKLKEI